MVTKFANLQLVALILGYFYICRIITNTKKVLKILGVKMKILCNTIEFSYYHIKQKIQIKRWRTLY